MEDFANRRASDGEAEPAAAPQVVEASGAAAVDSTVEGGRPGPTEPEVRVDPDWSGWPEPGSRLAERD